MLNSSLHAVEEKMGLSLSSLKKTLTTIRTGHASPTLIEHLKVDYAGMPIPLNQLAGITAPEARMLIIQPWDPSSSQAIEKAILKSELGLTPIADRHIIRLNIPPLTEERRQELVKMVHRRVEEGKIAIRNIRHDAVENTKKMEKNKEISQDELKRGLDHIQKLTDSFIVLVDQSGKDKEKELMEV
jgi:ribosome recycling factor